jgi:fibronectin type 3 domain-containing protein
VTVRLGAPDITNIYNVATGIELKWSKVPGATGYYVYRKKSSETKWTRVASVKSTVNKYTDNKAPTPYKYQYCVRTLKGSEQSRLSEPKIMYKIDAPVVNRLTNSATCRLTIGYSTNKYYSGYQITYATDNKYKTNVKTVTVGNPNTNNKTVTGLKKGKTYYVRTRSYRTVAGVKYYSNWGPTKSVKITK